MKRYFLPLVCLLVFSSACKKEASKPSDIDILTTGTWLEKTYQKQGDTWIEIAGDTIEYKFNSDKSGQRIFKRRNRYLFRSPHGQDQTGFYNDGYYNSWDAANGIGLPIPVLSPEKLTFNWIYGLKKVHLTFNEIDEIREWEVADISARRIDTKPLENINGVIPQLNGSSLFILKTVFEKN